MPFEKDGYLNAILSDDFRGAFGEKEMIVFYIRKEIREIRNAD
jgi:hypothetical protein